MSRSKDGAGRLLGPKGVGKWHEWRGARNRAIENPRRLKTAKDASDQQEKPSDATRKAQ